MRYRVSFLAVLALLLGGLELSCGGSASKSKASSNSELLFIADNCHCSSPLIRSFRLDTTTGALTEIASPAVAEWARPLVIDPKGRFLYAGLIQTTAQTVLGYSIDATTGQLQTMSSSPFFTVNGSHDVLIDPSGKFLYADGSGFAIDQNTGGLTPLNNPIGPTVITKDGIGLNFFCSAVGGPGTLSSYRIDSTGNLVNLANLSVTCVTGALAVDPTGHFIYVDQFIFKLDPNTGNMSQMPGSFPIFIRAFDPQGRFLYGGTANSSGFNAYRIDPTSGAPNFSSGPFSIQFGLGEGAVDPSGRFFVTSLEATYSIDQNTGALTAIQPAKNLNTTAIVFDP